MDLLHFEKRRLRELACLFAASRGALFAVGFLSTYLMISGLTVQHGNLIAHDPAPRGLEMWARWDSEWFLLIASDGYDVGDRLTAFGVPYERSAAAGFLPLYPLLIWTLSWLVGPVVAGILISNLCLLASIVLLERLVRLEFGGDRGASVSLAACVALLLFPSSLFLSAVYSESLFLLLSLAVFYASVTGRFAAAGVCGGLAALTRPFGVLLIIPIIMEWWRRWRADRGEGDDATSVAVWSVGWSALVPAGLAIFMLYCWRVFGDPLALLHRQSRWRGGLSGPWQAFVRWWEAGPVAHGSHGSTFELVMALFCLVVLVFMARRLRPVYTVYTAACMALALGSTLWSFSRLAVTLFPLFMVIGLWWADGRRCLVAAYAVFGATASGLLMALFANWWWAG
ncbi:MAG: mannosyltransferase family protein [Holophagae bacterium]|jgi:hypothetical protein